MSEQYTSILASNLFMNQKYEPQRTNNFELQIVGLSTIVRAGYTSDSTNHGYTSEMYQRLQSIDTTQEMILSIKGAFSPQVTLQSLEIPYGNTKTKFAGVPTYNDGSLSWVDYYDQDTEALLLAWRRAAFDDDTGAIGDAINYKRTAYLTYYSPSGRAARRFKLEGCWLQSVNGSAFSNDSASIRELSVTLVHDRHMRVDVSTETALKGYSQ